MKNVSPYISLQVPLEHLQEHLSFPLIDEAGYYCVFWWKEIPLGELFIEKAQLPVASELYQKIFNAIKPAVEFYIDKQNLFNRVFDDALINDQLLFTREMDQIFSGLLPVSFPEHVDISLIICTRNRSKYLQTCLEGLKNQRSQPGEIIVVDNAPSDGSSKIVVEKFAGIIYYLESRPGLDIARNAGARLAKYSIVTYIDDDVIAHPSFIYQTWNCFHSEKIVATTGLVIAASLETEAQQIFEKYWSFNRGYQDKIFGKEFFEINLRDGPPVWEIGAGANMAFRKSVFEQVGYFDELLDVGAAGCSGDSEIWYRILANGGSILYMPRPVVYHEHRKDLSQLHKQLYSYMRGFAAAALIQQDQSKKAGYRKRLFLKLPRDYFMMIVRAFPNYSFQNKTLFSEIRGVISGIIFYYKNKKTRTK